MFRTKPEKPRAKIFCLESGRTEQNQRTHSDSSTTYNARPPTHRGPVCPLLPLPPPRRPYPPTYALGPMKPTPPGSPNVETFLSHSSSRPLRELPRPPRPVPRCAGGCACVEDESESKKLLPGLYARWASSSCTSPSSATELSVFALSGGSMGGF